MKLIKAIICAQTDDGMMEWHFNAAPDEASQLILGTDRSGTRVKLEMVLDENNPSHVKVINK